ncbi:MAG: type III-B CRISPR module RAMP protein Cmr6 [Verrucomicrobiae bacterium]|nr:type III-B CRISPR module RAMP protein Cmr6 [Verrucomicrobiae bacterium]
MATALANDTRATLGPHAQQCQNRSLALDRFLNPLAKGRARQAALQEIVAKPSMTFKRDAWLRVLLTDLRFRSDELLLAQLQSRLLLNLSSGLLENAGLCLDRLSGIPFVPGSAVKACARRMAVQRLAKTETAEAKSGLLFRIALIFGWNERDWRDEPSCDLALACNHLWPAARTIAQQRLASHLGASWAQLPRFAGSVSFLPAYPIRFNARNLPQAEPAEGHDLVLEVLSDLHPRYRRGELGAPLDMEEPAVTVFPAVAPGHVFVFAARPTHRCMPELLDTARHWLKLGLEMFGLGARTAAGYGWFKDVSDVLRPHLDRMAADLRRARIEEERQRRAVVAAEVRRRIEEQSRQSVPRHDHFRQQYLAMGDEPFAAVAKKFETLSDDERLGFVQALKERRETAKRWAKKKPEMFEPWRNYAQSLRPPIQLP